MRGEVIDIHPAESDTEAVRVELFDDEIESLGLFDPLTGHVLRKTPRYTIYPKTHYVTPREQLLKAVDQVKDELRERLARCTPPTNYWKRSVWSNVPASISR